jgi:hypothetical protein
MGWTTFLNTAYAALTPTEQSAATAAAASILAFQVAKDNAAALAAVQPFFTKLFANNKAGLTALCSAGKKQQHKEYDDDMCQASVLAGFSGDVQKLCPFVGTLAQNQVLPACLLNNGSGDGGAILRLLNATYAMLASGDKTDLQVWSQN